MFKSFNGSKVKTQCQLCLGRIKLQRNKRQAQVKTLRKEVAELLRTNKQENARIRVENIIREQLMLQAFETLELFIQLLSVRTQQIEASREVPPDMLEALSSLVYAAHRLGTDLPELVNIRGHIGHKFGKEFVQESASDITCRKWHVNENVIKYLAVDPPLPEDKLATLSEVAQEFGVEWDAKRAADEMLPPIQYGVAAVGGVAMGGTGSVAPAAWTFPVDPQAAAAPPPAFSMPAPAPQPPLPDLMSLAPDPIAPLPHSKSEGGLLGPSQGGYADAAAAAEAARSYSEQARAAAEAAERFAAGGRGWGGDGGGGGGLVMDVTKSGNMAPDGPGIHDSVISTIGGAGASFPNIVHSSADTTASTGSDGVGAAGDPTAGRSTFVQRSDSDILRAYNAAPGPPSKPSPQPSAPDMSPTASPPGPPPASSAPPAGSGGSGEFGLPEPPANKPAVPPPAAPAPPAPAPKPVNELDELTKRFEALKRGDLI